MKILKGGKVEGDRFLAFGVVFIFWFSLHLVASLWAFRKLKREGVPENGTSLEGSAGSPADVHFPGDGVLRGPSVIGVVVAQGSLTLLDGALVTKSAHSQGNMTIGKGCVVERLATSCGVMRLESGATALVCSAPEITTGYGPDDSPNETPLGVAEKTTVIPGAMFQDRFRQLSADTWVCTGDLKLTGPVCLQQRLVVRGSFSAGAGSELASDLKATGDLTIGPDSTCRGKLLSEGTISLGARCRFEGILHAGRDLHLGEGVRSENGRPIVAYAAERVVLAQGIRIRGKVAAGRQLVVLP